LVDFKIRRQALIEHVLLLSYHNSNAFLVS